MYKENTFKRSKIKNRSIFEVFTINFSNGIKWLKIVIHFYLYTFPFDDIIGVSSTGVTIFLFLVIICIEI